MSSVPSAYTIKNDGLELVIALMEINRLLAHEETIPESLNALAARIQRDGVQSAPILVDRDSLVVLDGMHRMAAMRMLGCRFICVCMLDYKHSSIEVHKWCREVAEPFNEEKAREVTSSIGLSMTLQSKNVDLEQEREVVLVFRDKAYRVTGSNVDIENVLRVCYELECRLKALGYRVDHFTESEAVERVKNGSYAAAFCPPLIDKSQIVELASKHKVMIPKATRHRLPARPVQVNVPLSLLRDKDMSVEEANRVLGDMLRKKKLRRYNPGAEWMGRKYNEVLYVFG
jgi:hypothetical protein